MVLNLHLLPRYIVRFGPFAGLMSFIQVEWLKLEEITIKGVRHPVCLRRHTTDTLVFREVFLFRSYDLSLPQPKVVIDGGANIGLTSIFLVHKFPAAKIFSVEPSDGNFKVLVKNTKPYPQIIPIHSALWNKDATLKIKNENENQWAYTVEECEASNPHAFKATLITSLMNDYNIERIDILKLDVEGAEKEIFSMDFDFWMRRTRYILLELHDWLKPDCSRTVFETLARFHFKTSIFNGMLLLQNTDLE